MARKSGVVRAAAGQHGLFEKKRAVAVLPQVKSLYVYPVKAARGSALTTAEVEPWGLAGDRRWAVLDEQDRRLSPATCPAIMTVTATREAGGLLRLTAPGAPSLLVTPSSSAGAWLSHVLRRPARLTYLADPAQRPVPAEDGGRPGDVRSLAHAGPLHLTSAASLRRLDEWIAGEPLDMLRFRPNVVVDLDEPFAEDDWESVRLGDVSFRVAAACYRCSVTLIDPVTLDRGKEPLRTLAQHRRRGGRVYFGVWLVPQTLGTLRLGDPVVPVSRPGP
jgi:uncharacterized protein YcbX